MNHKKGNKWITSACVPLVIAHMSARESSVDYTDLLQCVEIVFRYAGFSMMAPTHHGDAKKNMAVYLANLQQSISEIFPSAPNKKRKRDEHSI